MTLTVAIQMDPIDRIDISGVIPHSPWRRKASAAAMGFYITAPAI